MNGVYMCMVVFLCDVCAVTGRVLPSMSFIFCGYMLMFFFFVIFADYRNAVGMWYGFGLLIIWGGMGWDGGDTSI